MLLLSKNLGAFNIFMHFLQIIELQTQKHRGQSLTQYFCFRKLVIF
nr:MAG TPA: hypothetical protein [Caudoviricetes sp.]